MKLVVITGQPASGKSQVAGQLKAGFEERGCTVDVVDEPSLHLQRNQSYSDVRNEKNTRGELRSALDRVLAGKSSVVIFDTLNNIKGYRYELWCLARAASARYCMVHVDTDVETCRLWNSSRPLEEQYSNEIFDDLAARFERPDQRNRWDSPLFTVKPSGDPDEAQQVITALLTSMTEKGDGVAAPAEGVSAVRDLTPTTATGKPLLLSTNLLHDMDHAVQVVLDAVVDGQAAAAGGPAGLVRLPVSLDGAQPSTSASGLSNSIPLLQLDQVVSLAELRRHKRSFLKLATKVTFSRISDVDAARRMFVDYLIDNVPGCSRPPRNVT